MHEVVIGGLVGVAQALFPIAGAIVLLALPVLARHAMTLFERESDINLNATAVNHVLGAVATASGTIKAALRLGEMELANVKVSDPRVQKAASVATHLVSDVVDSLGLSQDDVAHLVVGHIERSLGTPPVTHFRQNPTNAPVTSGAPAAVN